jgi:hypothetical protein
VAKIFNLDRFIKRKRGKSPSTNDANSPSPDRHAGSKVLRIDRVKRAKGAPWPASTAHTSLNAGAAFLLVIGVLCGLYLSGSDKKIATSNPDRQLSTGTTPQQSMPAQSLAKPSPVVPADSVQGQGSVVARQAAPNSGPILPATPAPRFLPTRFEATHKKAFGGCTGQLELTAARLRFSCPHQPDLNFPVGAIAKVHKDGVVLKSGEKYHFTIANHTKDQAEAIFESWLSRAQQSPQTAHVATF